MPLTTRPRTVPAERPGDPRPAAPRRAVLAGLAGLAASALPGRATAQAYPDRPVWIVVPYAAGGAVDIVGRTLASDLAAGLGQPVNVENRTGAGGNIAAAHVAKSKPDGHVLMIGGAANSVAKQVFANLQYDPNQHWNKEDWNREARLEDFLPRFEGMRFDWLDVPALIRAADKVYEYPMVDRDPLERWTLGLVSLMGDAAHAAYPVGSNGAGSALIDARRLGRAFVDHGVTSQALQVYEDQMRPITSKVVLTNRVAGPDQILDVVEERCGGWFERIDDVISQQELAEHATRYKAIAGYAIDLTNAAPPTIPSGARVH